MQNKIIKNENWEKKIRQACTYYSDLDEGTAGYSLSGEQFQEVFSIIRQLLTSVAEEVEAEETDFRNRNKITLGYATLKEAHDYGYDAGLLTGARIIREKLHDHA